jgi:hypothetical protein
MLKYFLFLSLVLFVNSLETKPSFCLRDPNHRACRETKQQVLLKFCIHDPHHPNCSPKNQLVVRKPKSRFFQPKMNLKKNLTHPKELTGNHFVIFIPIFCLLIFLLINFISLSNFQRKQKLLKEKVESLILTGNVKILKDSELKSLMDTKLKTKCLLILQFDQEIQSAVQYQTSMKSTENDLENKIEEWMNILLKINLFEIPVNVEPLKKKIEETEIELKILHSLECKQHDFNDYLLSKSILNAETINLNSEIVQHANEILQVRKKLQKAITLSEKENNFSLIEKIIESTPKIIQKQLYITFDKAKQEMVKIQLNSTTSLISIGSQKIQENHQSMKMNFEDSEEYIPKELSTNLVADAYIKTNVMKMMNDNEQKELDRRNFERQTDKQIEQQIISSGKDFELKIKQLHEKSKVSSLKQDQLNLEKEKMKLQEEREIEKEKSNLYSQDLNSFYILVLFQFIFSSLIYTMGSLESIIFENCKNSEFCFFRFICFEDFISSFCEKGIILGIVICVVFFLILISYFNVGYYGILFLFISIFYWKRIFIDLIYYYGIVLFLQWMVVCVLGGRKWKFNGKDFKILLNFIFILVSSFFCFVTTIYLASNKNENCSIMNLKHWNQCNLIKQFLE